MMNDEISRILSIAKNLSEVENSNELSEFLAFMGKVNIDNNPSFTAQQKEILKKLADEAKKRIQNSEI